ncbi:MAG: aminotransferase class V-fold PLP-dependent enzyme, partial [Acidobacteriaceae bacterium]|nr:aminotransferase class V-fold PLP-dependent enzyme [Acidobacteriaceae bacterium]
MLYFDHNASTPVVPEVAEAFSEALRNLSGNASSMHRAGQIARQRLEGARIAIASELDCSPAELVFTSGGTESNNLAVLGLVRNLQPTHKHVITTAIEHPAVLEPMRQLQRERVDLTFANVCANGIVDPTEIERRMRAETVLVSVMHANNETGAVQPIEEIAAIVARRRA